MVLETYRPASHGRLITRGLMVAPIIFSLIALAIVVGNVAAGVPRQADEVTAAHLFQLLMAAQVPLVVGFIAITDWSKPSRPLVGLTAQALAFAAALAVLAWSGY